MRSWPTILAILSFPAGVLAYGVTLRVLQGMSLPDQAQTLVFLFVPLLVAGLVMMPLLIPIFDRKAKADLAYLRSHASRDPDNDPNDDDGPGPTEPAGPRPSRRSSGCGPPARSGRSATGAGNPSSRRTRSPTR